MKQKSTFSNTCFASMALFTLIFSACTTAPGAKPDPVAANIKAYTHVWDEVMNKGRLDMINDSNFTTDVTFHMKPADVVGIDSARAFYANFINGFSNIQFTIKDVFGQGDKLVKHWNFKGKHSGNFFGIPATGKSVDLDGSTIVLMRDGKIAKEQDFYDNMDFMTQLGLMPAPGK